MVNVRKPAARKPAPASSLPVKTRRAATPAKREASKPAPAAKKAAPAKSTSQQRNEQLAAARASYVEKTEAAKAAPTEKHPVRKDKISSHDVVRAWHTALMLQFQYAVQEGEEIAEALEFVAPIMGGKKGPVEKSPLTRAKVAPEKRVIGEYYDKEIVEKYSIKDLRELAERLELDEQKYKTGILKELEAKGFFREDGDADADEDGVEDDVDEDIEEDEVDGDDEDSDDDDSEDDDDETEERVYDRDDLKGMTLKELQELAEANEVNFKGLGKAELIDTLLADEDEEEEDESDDEDEEGEDAPVEIDPDELPNMDLDELLELCEQIDVKVPASKKKNKKAVIQLILDELEDEE